MDQPPDLILELLRSEHRGVLLAGGRPHRWCWVRCPRQGRLLGPVEREVLESGEAVLCVPDEGEDAAQCSVEVRVAGAADNAAMMRWGAYHGEARHAQWASASIVAAKWHGAVWDGGEINLTSPLAPDEPALVKLANGADRRALVAACERAAGVAPESPVVVGADALGLDVRARFGIIRLSFASAARDLNDARSRIAELLGGAAS